VSRSGTTSRSTSVDPSKSGAYAISSLEAAGLSNRATSDARRRDETAIIYDILALAASEPANKTRIVYRCNLNFVKAQRLVDELLAASLLSEEKEEGRPRYRTTAQGASYLRQVEVLRALRSGAHV
jgi:predicted transcriptional regulator